jgi:hypothetical protein
MPTRVTFRGREVTRQPQRSIVALTAITGGCLAFLLLIPTMLIFVPISLPFHFIIKVFNGRGFSKWENGAVTYTVPWWFCLAIVAVFLVIIL